MERLAPLGSDMTPYDFSTAAMQTPEGALATFGGAVADGANNSFGLGTLLREAQTPNLAKTVVSAGRGGVQWRNDTSQEVASRGDTLYQSEDAYKASPFYRDGIPFEAGMTASRAKALADQNDLSKVREYFGNKRPYVNFAGSLIGAALDPVNYIPIANEASGAYLAAKFGKVLGGALRGSADAALNAAAFGALTAPQRAKFGDDTSWTAIMQNAAFAAMAGAVFGGAHGAVKAYRSERLPKFSEPSRPEINQFMAAADTSAPKVDPSFNPAELQQALDGAVPRSGDVTAKLQPETRVAAEPTYTLDPMLSRLETQAMRSKSAMVMNDALFGMINDGEVNLGERSQGHISDMQGMAEKIAPRIEAQPILNLDQIHQDAKTVGVDLHASDANGKITVSKIVTNESQRGLGLGTKVMNDLIAFADANGKDIALTPSKDFGGSVPRLKKFYERLGFVENKGKAKDFSTRETMIRPAQKIEAKPIEQAKTEAISTKKSFTVPSPEPQLPELKAAYAALDAAPKAAIEPNAIEAKAIQEAKAEGFDPVANTNDHELDIVALRDQGLLTKEDEAMLKAADETHAAVGAWEDVMNVARECFLK